MTRHYDVLADRERCRSDHSGRAIRRFVRVHTNVTEITTKSRFELVAGVAVEGLAGTGKAVDIHGDRRRDFLI